MLIKFQYLKLLCIVYSSLQTWAFNFPVRKVCVGNEGEEILHFFLAKHKMKITEPWWAFNWNLFNQITHFPCRAFLCFSSFWRKGWTPLSFYDCVRLVKKPLRAISKAIKGNILWTRNPALIFYCVDISELSDFSLTFSKAIAKSKIQPQHLKTLVKRSSLQRIIKQTGGEKRKIEKELWIMMYRSFIQLPKNQPREELSGKF